MGKKWKFNNQTTNTYLVLFLWLFLPCFFVGASPFFLQSDAKRAVAIALRNRWRRTKLSEDLKVRRWWGPPKKIGIRRRGSRYKVFLPVEMVAVSGWWQQRRRRRRWYRRWKVERMKSSLVKSFGRLVFSLARFGFRYSVLGTRYSTFVILGSMFGVGYSIFAIRCSLFGARYLIVGTTAVFDVCFLGFRCSIFGFQFSMFEHRLCSVFGVRHSVFGVR